MLHLTVETVSCLPLSLPSLSLPQTLSLMLPGQLEVFIGNHHFCPFLSPSHKYRERGKGRGRERATRGNWD